MLFFSSSDSRVHFRGLLDAQGVDGRITVLSPGQNVTHSTCDRCGRTNPAHAAFCLECGQRLGIAYVAPTPPTGVDAGAAAHRPSPRATGGGASSARIPTAAGIAVGTRRCVVCSASNPNHVRFCAFCGATLEPVPPVNPGGTPPSPADLPPSSRPDAVASCPSCAADVDEKSVFCRRCGHRLANVAAAAPAAVPPREEVRAKPVPQPERHPKRGSNSTSSRRGKLVTIAKSGSDGTAYPFETSVDIGRSEGDVVLSEDAYLSPRHARLVWHNDALVIRDLGSVNGVYVRLRTRPSGGADAGVELSAHEFILIGQQVLEFQALADHEAGLGPAKEHGTLVFGSPTSPRYARLLQRTVEGAIRDVHYVRKAETILGRESGDWVVTEDPFLSRRHAAIRVSQSGPVSYRLVDLGSSNGTFLRIKGDIELESGDYFRVGQQLFRIDLEATSK